MDEIIPISYILALIINIIATTYHEEIINALFFIRLFYFSG